MKEKDFIYERRKKKEERRNKLDEKNVLKEQEKLLRNKIEHTLHRKKKIDGKKPDKEEEIDFWSIKRIIEEKGLEFYLEEEGIEEHLEKYGYKLSAYDFINKIGIDESDMDQAELSTLSELVMWCKKASVSYRNFLIDLILEHQQENDFFTDKLRDEMMKRNLFTPSFTIYGKDAGNEFLKKCGVLNPPKLEKGEFLLNFQLPKILARFWNIKGINPYYEGPEIIRKKIPWGKLYFDSMPDIWKHMDNTNFPMERINQHYEHSPIYYYYLFKIYSSFYDN